MPVSQLLRKTMVLYNMPLIMNLDVIELNYYGTVNLRQ